MREILVLNTPANQDNIPISEWKKYGAKYINFFPEEIETMILHEIASDQEFMISKSKLIDLVDTYQFLPVKVKRNKN